MRTVGCDNIANDPVLLETTLGLYQAIESSTATTSIIFPWLPTPAALKRTIAGGRFYMIFKSIVNQRKRTNQRADDALQYLIDHVLYLGCVSEIFIYWTGSQIR